MSEAEEHITRSVRAERSCRFANELSKTVSNLNEQFMESLKSCALLSNAWSNSYYAPPPRLELDFSTIDDDKMRKLEKHEEEANKAIFLFFEQCDKFRTLMLFLS